MRHVRRGLLFLALLALVYGGWRWGPHLVAEIRVWTGATAAPEERGPAPSQATADSVLARFQSFRRQGPGTMALGGREVTSVLRYSLPGLVPTGVRDLEVRLLEGSVVLSARVALAAFPQLPDLGPILGILPDTVDVQVRASLLPLGDEELALLVQGMEASRVPVPRRLIPEILTAMGRVHRPGLPPEALPVPLPAGLSAAYILTDSLILSSTP